MAVISTSYDVQSGFDTTLKNSISATQTSNIIINEVLTITFGVLNFDPDTAKEEWVGFGGITDNGNGTCTLVDVTRGLSLTGDTFSGSSTRAFSHSGGACKVVLVDYHSLFNLKANKDRENTFTADQTIGAGKKIKFTDATTSIRLDGSDLKLKDGNTSEVSLSTLAAAAGVDEKSKVSVSDTTSGFLDTKVTVGEGLSKSITSPAGDERLNVALDTTATTTGQTFVNNNLPTIPSLGTSGTANTSITSGNALSYNGNQKLDLADGNDANMNQEWLFAGISKTTGIAGDTINYVQPGPIATVPAFTMSQRANCRQWAYSVLNTTQNTATDVMDASTKWRGQTFTTSAIAGEDNVSAISLYLTKTGSPTGSATLSIYQVSGGLPFVNQNITQTSQNSAGDILTAATSWRAQTFSATATSVTSVTLYIAKTGSPTGDATVYIKELSAGNPTGATIGTATLAMSSITTGANVFTFSSAITLTPGTSYAIVLDPGAGVSGGAYISWNYNNSSVYAGGTSWTSSNSGSTYTQQATFDRYFVLTATATILGTTTLAMSSITTGVNEFSFTTPVALSASTQYAIVLDPGSGVSGAAYIAWNYQNTDVYAGGQSATSSTTGVSWTAEPTFDRYFSMKFRGIAGEPVYLSDTAGNVDLAPGTYANRIGYAISTTQITLLSPEKTIFATYSFSDNTAGETVSTEILIGFRATSIVGVMYNGNSWSNQDGFASMGIYVKGGSSTISTWGARPSGAPSNGAGAAWGGTGFLSGANPNSSGTVGTIAISISSVGASSITLTRSINAHTTSMGTITIALTIN